MSEILPIEALPNLPIAMAAVHGGLVYVSGQVGFQPGTTVVVGSDFKSQCRQTMANVDAVLEKAGTRRSRIIQIMVYLKEVERDFTSMNRLFADWLDGHKPARSTIGVQLARPDLLIEIDCIAALP